MSFDHALVEKWIALQRAIYGSEEYERLIDESTDPVYEMTHKRPDAAWDFILEVLRVDDSDEIMGNLAAGPLEDLLAYHGPYIIERVEQEARANPKFASLLGGVWQNVMPDDIWRRVRAVWDRRGWDGIPVV